MRPLTPARIKALRERLGMSQAEFAKTFRLSIKTLQSWEAGAKKPSGPTSVLLWLIDRIPQAVIKALKED
jgi:putative transcriptional regulator